MLDGCDVENSNFAKEIPKLRNKSFKNSGKLAI
jgi:hypothetical protein